MNRLDVAGWREVPLPLAGPMNDDEADAARFLIRAANQRYHEEGEVDPRCGCLSPWHSNGQAFREMRWRP